jgi:hypothetical protein
MFVPMESNKDDGLSNLYRLSPFNSSVDEGDRRSGASASTTFTPIHSSASSPSRKSPVPITPIERSKQPSVSDLEIRLDTGRTIDLFSMNLKVIVEGELPPRVSIVLTIGDLNSHVACK